jgi:hypothetical protein
MQKFYGLIFEKQPLEWPRIISAANIRMDIRNIRLRIIGGYKTIPTERPPLVSEASANFCG